MASKTDLITISKKDFMDIISNVATELTIDFVEKTNHSPMVLMHLYAIYGAELTKKLYGPATEEDLEEFKLKFGDE